MRITIKAVVGRQVRIAIDAPKALPIYREEIYQAITRANNEAVLSERFARSVLSFFSEPGGQTV